MQQEISVFFDQIQELLGTSNQSPVRNFSYVLFMCNWFFSSHQNHIISTFFEWVCMITILAVGLGILFAIVSLIKWWLEWNWEKAGKIVGDTKPIKSKKRK